jgi:mono/diheme cytochrome c family protein
MRGTMLVMVLLLGLVAGRTPAQDPAAKPETTEVARTAVPLEIPAKDKARRNPLQPTEENLERGMQIYSSQCAMCHGVKGEGDGGLAGTLKMAMPDLTDPVRQKQRTDGELFYILTNGHGRMPAEGDRLPEEFRWSMILAIRSMARDAR